MVTIGVKWILFPLFILLGNVSATATNPNCNPELNLSDTLWWSDFNSRLTLDVRPGHSVVSICGLQAGEKYSLLLHPLSPEAKGSIRCMAPGVTARPKTEQIQEFIAREDCATIELYHAMEHRVASTLSLGCLTCPPPASTTERSMMGIQVNPNYSANALIEDVFISGNCFSVDENSIDFDGYNSGLAYFNSGMSSVNFEEGLMISTGRATNAEGGNDSNSRTTELQSIFASASDPDLEQLIGFSERVFDVQVLEFEFTPTSSEISFDYVFASEEYCEYVDSDYNDVFGFFISGPGINGPFSNNAENIAQIPGSSDYITINNVNHNSNPAYYVDNIPASHFVLFPFVAFNCTDYPIVDGAAINDLEFDGFTTVLTAKAEVIPCQTYRIKLAIADVADRRFDSAVFLKANSFSSGGSALAEVELPDSFGGSALEGCIGGNFVFQRQDVAINEPLTVHYTVSTSSTAEAGIDYAPLPDSIVIPAGEEFFYLPVEVYSDLLVEGTETILLELEAPCSCSTPFTQMTIADSEPLTLNLDDQMLCEPVATQLTAAASGGLADYSYVWNTGDTGPLLSVFPQSDTTYFVTVTDFCGREATDSVSLTFLGIPEATISGDFEICPEGDPAFLQILFSTPGTFTLVYSINGIPQPPINNITENPFVLETAVPGIYELIAVENSFCTGMTFGSALVSPLDIDVLTTVEEVTCPGANDGSIWVQVTGGLAPYSYQWSNTTQDTPVLDNLFPGQYLLTITEAGGCTLTQSYQIVLSSTVPFADAGTSNPLTCSKTEINLIADGSIGGTYSYLWTTPDGNILSGETTTNPLVNEPGTYTFWVTNDLTNCTISDEVVVGIDTVAPQAEIIALGPLMLSCETESTVLDGSSSQPQGAISFTWFTSDGQVPPGTETLMQIEPELGGTYQLLVTNSINGCTALEAIEVQTDTTAPEAIIAIPGILTCRDSIIVIDASASSSGAQFSYRWSTPDGNIMNGSSSQLLEVDEPGWYYLEINNSLNGCQTIDVVEVGEDKIPPLAEAGTAEELDCDSPVVVLDGTSSTQGDFYSYLWTTLDGNIISDSTNLLPEINTQGTYYLQVTNEENGCTALDFIFVEENTNRPFDLNIQAIAPLCFGDLGSFSVDAVMGGEGPFVYSYDDGETYSSETNFNQFHSGTYQLLVQDINGCEFTKAFVIPFVPERLVLLDPLVEIQLGESGDLSAVTNMTAELIESIIWSPEEGLSCTDCLDPEVTGIFDTRYTLTVVDTNGCVASDETLLRVGKDRNVYIPNAFSPNGDGANDTFFINSDSHSVKQINRFRIYDRWGEQLFESLNVQPNDPSKGWDGTFKGEELNPGVYTYYAELEFVDNVRQLFKGDVSLIK